MAVTGRRTTRRTGGGTQVTATPGAADTAGDQEDEMSGRVNLPALEEDDQDQTSGSRLDRARALFAQNQDATDRARLDVPEADTPNTLMQVPAEAASLPIAVRAQIVQAAAIEDTRRAVLRRANASQLPGTADLRSRGVSPDVGGTVEQENDQIQCPNCGRSWPYRYNLAGSTIPCSGCGYLVEVALPEALRQQVVAAEDGTEAGSAGDTSGIVGTVPNESDTSDPNAPKDPDQE